jgi:hypothetical protein
MKKHYFTILQILLLCLISSTTSFANKTSNMSSSKTLNHLVLDIECPASFTESASPSCEFVVPDYTTLAVVTGAEASAVITQSPLPTSLYGLGVITITLTANDGSTIVSCSFDVEVIDTTSPSLTCPVDQFEVSSENCEFIIPDYTPLGSAVDFCSAGNIPVTQNPPAGTLVSENTMVFLLATDSNGNTGACSFNVIISDIIPPTIECPADINEMATIDCLFTIPDYTSLANANDNCAVVLVTQTPAVGTQVSIGVTTITLIASDGGSTTSCEFNITVLDTSPPIVMCPEDQIEDYDVNCQFILPDYRSLATITDTCYPGPFTVTQVPPPGTLITGDVSVTITAEDNVGNVGSCSFMVIQNDVIPPTITCPSNQIEEVNAVNCMFIIPDYTALANAQDGCNDQVVITQSPAPGTQVGLGATTITLTASDGFNTANCTFEIEVQNTTTPNAVCRAPFDLPLDADGNATLTPSQVDGGSNAYCDIASMSIDITNFNCDDLGIHPVTLTIIDTNGNISSCTTTVTITDPLFACNELPVALCQALVVSANANCEGEATAQDFDNGSFDPDNMPFTLTISPEGPYPLGTTTVVLTIYDGEYTDSCDTTITVVDTTAPSLTCLDNQVVAVNTACFYVVPNYLSQVTASDNCGVVSVEQNPLPGTIISTGVIQVTITANDGVNQSVCTFNLTVVDQTAPTAICQNIILPLDNNGLASISASDIDSGSSDNCGTITSSIDIAAFTCDDIGENIVTLTITDQAGLITTCNAVITVVDTMAPQVVCQDITLILGPTGQATISAQDIDGGSTDNCGVVSYSIDTTSFDCSSSGQNFVTLTVTDASGNTNSCTATVTIVDQTAPSLTCLDDQIETVDTSCSFVLPNYTTSLIATDNCNTLTVTQDPLPGTVLALGVTTVTITASDGSFDTLCSFNVIVTDVIAPTAICQNITLPLDANGAAGISTNDIDFGSTDNCGTITSSLDRTTFSCNDIGENMVALTIIDQAGLVSTCTALVTVVDTLAPQIFTQDITVSLDANGQVSITAQDINAGSTDNCGIVSYSIDTTTFDCSNTGDNLVTLTLTDASGNTNTSSAIVTVVDTIAPTAICQNITIELDASGNAAITPSDIDAGSFDNCSASQIALNQTNFDCSMVGQNEVVFTITDASGITATCLAMVTVENNNLPVAACQNITVQLNSSGLVFITAADLDGGSTLTCSQQATIELDQYSFDCNDVGVNEVTLSITQTNGLTTSCIALVNVEDAIAPTVVCQNITVTLDQDGMASIAVADINAGSFDACGIAAMSLDTDTFDCSMTGVNPVTLSVTDVNGNTSSCQATVTVVDATYPTALCQSITLILDENGLATLTPDDLDQGSSDNCTGFTTSVSIENFDCSNIGVNNVLFTITDMQGNVSSCNAIVTVLDTTAPIMSCQDIIISLNEELQVNMTLNELFAGWSDNCTIETRIADVTSFDCANIGDNLVTLTAIDPSGNEATCSITVTVQEGVFAPNAVCQNVTVPLQQDGTASITAGALNGGSTGVRCQDGFSVDRTDFSCADIGAPILVEFTVYNSIGESDSCFAYVNVIDGLSPEIICPEDQTVSSEGPYVLPDYFATGEADAIDNCSTSLVTNQSPNPGTLLEQGTYTISLEAIDEGGFESTCEFVLIVNDLLGSQDTELLLEGITLYPNPASQNITITNPQFVGLQGVTLFDVTGRKVKYSSISGVNDAVVLDVSELKSTMYLVVISTEYGQVVKQLIKQ